MSSQDRLSGLEFMGLLTGVVPSQVEGVLRLRLVEAPRLLEEAHRTSTGSTPAEVVADLIISILQVRPFDTSDAHPDRPDPNIVLCIAATHAYLDRIGRGLLLDAGTPDDAPTSLELELLSMLDEAANDPLFARGQLVARLNPLLPADVWAPPAPTPILAGVSATIAFAVTGVPSDELEKTRLLAGEVRRELESLGFSVKTCTEHTRGEDCSSGCATSRNVDLLVVLQSHPSIRVGHQIKGVSDLLGLTLTLVPRKILDISCLFKSPQLGRFTVKRFGGAAEARRKVQEYVIANAALIDKHAIHRVTRDDWHRASFFELRERVANRMSVNNKAEGPGLVTRAQARHLVSSIDVYSGASITLINTIRDLVGLSPLGGYVDAVYDGLFSVEQLYELDVLVDAGDILREDRSSLVAQAARGLVAAGRSEDRRTRTFLGPDDWVGEYDSLLASRN